LAGGILPSCQGFARLVWVTMGVVLAAVALLAAAAPARAAFPGSNGKIAFDSQRDPGFNFDIYSMNADGSGQTSLTSDPEDDFAPAWSPDGSKIAFYTFRNGSAEVWVMNANGSGQAGLTNQATAPNSQPAWSPDGAKIVFVSRRNGNDEIYTMNANGTSPTRLTNNTASEEEPAFSPDGTKIAFVSDRDGNREIYTMNADGTSQTRLTNDAADDYAPNWSPNGLQITFTSIRDGNTEIYRMSFGGGAQTRLTFDSEADEQSAYSPDGTRITFESQIDGCCTPEIYSMLSSGSGASNLTQDLGDDGNPDWQPLQNGSIVVKLTSQPSDPQDFSFTAGGGLSPTSFSLDDDLDPALSNTQTFASVAAHAGYTLAESVPAGWDLQSATCDNGSPVSNIDVAPGQTVTCTFTNRKRGKVVVVENSLPDDAQNFSFTAAGGLSPTSFTLDDDANPTLSNTQTFNDVVPASGYSVAETVPTGWDLQSATCDNGNAVTSIDVAAGQTVTCTFTNRKRGSLVIVEDSLPNDAQDFSFAAAGGLSPASFQLDDDSDPVLTNTRTFNNVIPGSGYSVSETVPSGWDQTSATCDNGSAVSNINVANGQTVTCTFTNRKRGSVVIVKDSQPNDAQDFSFAAGGGLSPTSFQLDDDSDPGLTNTRTFSNLIPGSGYSVSETVPSGWDQSSATCDNGSAVSNINVANGQTVTCTFVNKKRGTLVIVEDSVPNNGQDFSFTASGGLSPTSFVLDDDNNPQLSNTQTFSSLVARNGYAVSVASVSGWDLQSATCSNGSPVSNIDVTPGQTITCTFVNQKRGSIAIVKDAQPNDAQDFTFNTGGGLGVSSFQLDDDSDGTLSNTHNISDVVPASGYSVSEVVPSGWDQSSATCNDGSPVSNISVSAGESVTCTFVNQKRGSIVVVKDAQPNDAQDFSFTAGGGLSPTSFQLDDDSDPTLSNTRTFASLLPASGYSLSETVPSGWDQSSATCDNGSAVSNVTVSPGQTVTCTFVNKKRGSIVVVKDAQPNDAQDFSFTAGGGLSPTSFQLDDDADPTLSNTRTFANVPAAGGYSLSETVPSGWDQTAATCDNGNAVSSITVAAGQTVTCTFTNRKRGTIVVVKDAQPDDSQDFDFTAGGGLSPGSFTLDDDANPTLSNTQTLANVVPGSGYSISESVPSGWDQTAATCDNGDAISSITVAAGQTVTCTFTNRKRGTIVVVKDAQPDDSQDFDFTAGGGLSPGSFTLDDDANPTLSNTQTLANVVPGSGYSISESVPSGWDQTAATCDNGDAISSITVAAGQTVTCTFTNRKRGTIVVVKDAQPDDSQDFDFTAGGGLSPGSFTLDDDANPTLSNTQTFANVVPGSGYSISESVPSGWTQSSATCDDGSPPGNIAVSAGETVTCTFVNAAGGGTIVLVEDSQPNNAQNFSFSAGGGLTPTSLTLDDDSDPTLPSTHTFADVPAGNGYSLSETIPSGWKQAAVSCDDGSPVGSIDVANGETITCTFVNAKVFHDSPAQASTLDVPLVPEYRQTISATQCQSRGGVSSTHGPPLSASSCNPPALAAGTQAHLGSQAAGQVQIATAAGDLTTPADEADVSFAADLTDVRAGSRTGADYNPNPGGDDATIVFRLRISDLFNGASPPLSATVTDTSFSTPVNCATTADPSTGADCSTATSANAVMPGAIREGQQTVFAIFRVRLFDSGANGVRGDSDDRSFAMQGYYVP
jgi:Tol biopolymer transport system component/agmatine/peptidylarginine deiminase